MVEFTVPVNHLVKLLKKREKEDKYLTLPEN